MLPRNGRPDVHSPVGRASGPVPAASAGRTTGGSVADLAAIEKLRQLDISATMSLDPVALTSAITDDFVRIGPVPPEKSASKRCSRLPTPDR